MAYWQFFSFFMKQKLGNQEFFAIDTQWKQQHCSIANEACNPNDKIKIKNPDRVMLFNGKLTGHWVMHFERNMIIYDVDNSDFNHSKNRINDITILCETL